MITPKMECRISERWETGDLAVYFYSVNGKDIDVYYTDRKVVRRQEGEDCEPTLYINRSGVESFLKSAAELGFFQEKIKESESVISTKDAHLQDMRRLVFKEEKQ